MIFFFAPCLGLFNIFHILKPEQIPFKIRREFPSMTKPDDEIALFNVSEPIYWKDLDRNDYTDPNNPIPPDYTVYTLMSIKTTFFCFIGLSLIHFAATLLVKKITVRDFWTNKKFAKFIHLLECLNISSPYRDWDDGEATVEEHRERFKQVRTEMIWSFILNIVVSILHLIPTWITGSFLILYSNKKTHRFCFSVNNIFKRYNFLKKYFGTKEEEDVSYNNAVLLYRISTVGMIAVCVLEMIFYFVYSEKVIDVILVLILL